MKDNRFLISLLMVCLLALAACRPLAGEERAETPDPTASLSASVTATVGATSTPVLTTTPATTAMPLATATVPIQARPVAAGPFCPEIPRPALLTVSDSGYAISHPSSGASCEPALPPTAGEAVTIAGEYAFYAASGGEEIAVHRANARGEGGPLDFTRRPADSVYHFAVSDDGVRLAWSAATVEAVRAAGANDVASTLWLADLGTDAWRALLGPEVHPDAVLVPIRFAAGGRQLLYTVQPIVLDAVWNSFGGRYHNLYSIEVDAEGATGSLLFDCESVGADFCIGDVHLTGDRVAAIAYVNAAGELMVGDGSGKTRSLAGGAPYTGFTTFHEDGSLAFLATSPTVPEPEWVGLFLLSPPYDSQPVVLAESAGLRSLLAFYDANHVIASYANTADDWTVAVAAAGEPLTLFQRDPAVRLLDVLPGLAVSPWADRFHRLLSAVGLPAGWEAASCDGEGSFLCIRRNGMAAGVVEVLAYTPEMHTEFAALMEAEGLTPGTSLAEGDASTGQ